MRIQDPVRGGFRMDRVYVGCLEAPHGFMPVRDPRSKWCATQPEPRKKPRSTCSLCAVEPCQCFVRQSSPPLEGSLRGQLSQEPPCREP